MEDAVRVHQNVIVFQDRLVEKSSEVVRFSPFVAVKGRSSARAECENVIGSEFP